MSRTPHGRVPRLESGCVHVQLHEDSYITTCKYTYMSTYIVPERRYAKQCATVNWFKVFSLFMDVYTLSVSITESLRMRSQIKLCSQCSAMAYIGCCKEALDARIKLDSILALRYDSFVCQVQDGSQFFATTQHNAMQTLFCEALGIKL